MDKEMQKPITQAELKAILSHPPADFSGRLLVGIELSYNRSLECSNFRNAVLRGCTFSHCKLDNSAFMGADLGDTAFIQCKMEYCGFGGARMENASFDHCATMGSIGINGDIRMQAEVVFDDTMGMIQGVNMDLAPAWRQFAWEICMPDQHNYDSLLREYQRVFPAIDEAYPGMGAEIFNSGFHFWPYELSGAANFIAKGNTVEAAHRLAVDCALNEEFLPVHEMFVLPHSDVQQNLLAERSFVAQIRVIQGADFGKLQDWLNLARDLGDDSGEGYRQQLREFGEAFEEVEESYPGVAAAMFNCEAAYLPGEMLPAAEWISNGGSAEEAVDMAQAGAFEQITTLPPGYKTIDLIASYEDTFAVPYEERLTRYWGDYGGHVRKDGVTDEQLREVYAKALGAMELSSGDFQGWLYGGRGEVVMHMRNCLLAKTLCEGDEILFIPPCPTGQEGQFQYEIGQITEINAANKNCVVADEDGEMTVPLRYVLARFDDELPGNAFAYEYAQPLYYLPEPWPGDLMCQAREAYEQQLSLDMDDNSDEEFAGMTMKM